MPCSFLLFSYGRGYELYNHTDSSVSMTEYSLKSLVGASLLMVSSLVPSVEAQPAETRSFTDFGGVSIPSVERGDTSLEDSVEADIDASILHQYDGAQFPPMRRRNVRSFASISDSLADAGISFAENNEDTVFILSDDLERSRLGLYVPDATTWTLSDSSYVETDRIYIDAPRYTFSGPGRDGVKTVLHEHIHDRVNGLPEGTRTDLYDCFRSASSDQYLSDVWSAVPYSMAWSQGMVSSYATRNVHEDIAETATGLLYGEPSAWKQRFEQSRTAMRPTALLSGDALWHDGVESLQEKHGCLSVHGVYRGDEPSVASETMDELYQLRHLD